MKSLRIVFLLRKKSKNPNFDEYDIKSQKDEVETNIREICGSLQWVVTICRPDIAKSVNMLSHFTAEKCTQNRLLAAQKVIGYLLYSKNIGITYSPQTVDDFENNYRTDGPGNFSTLSAFNLFTDASWASARDSFYSVSGAVLTYKGSLVWWKSSRQTIQAESTCQAEFISAADALKEIDKLGFLTFFLGGKQSEGGYPDDLTLWIDSTSAKAAAESSEPTSKTRHYVLRYFKVRELAQKGPNKLKFCVSALQRADALTKSASPESRKVLMGEQNFNVNGYLLWRQNGLWKRIE